MTNIPHLFAEQTQQITSIITRTGKKYRIVNLDVPSVISKSATKLVVTSIAPLESWLKVSWWYDGTGSCIRDMSQMQWTWLQIYHGDYLSGWLLSWNRSFDTGQWTGVWSWFNSQTMILTSTTGITMHEVMANDNHYLAMRSCVRSSWSISYPSEWEYLSWLVMMTGELGEFPKLFTGVMLIDTLKIYSDIQWAKVVSWENKSQAWSLDTWLWWWTTSVVTSRPTKPRPVSWDVVDIDPHTIIIRSGDEFNQLINKSIITAQRQSTKRLLDNGKINKLQLNQAITYESSDTKTQAQLSATTVIFTAQWQELQAHSMMLQQVQEVSPRKKNKEDVLPVIEFGTPWDHLIFTQPVKIISLSDQPDGTVVNISVKHADDMNYSKQWLSIDSYSSCDLEWNASRPATETIVQWGQIIFYTCGASTFSFNYGWWADYANYVDNGSLTKTIVITADDVTPAFTIDTIQIVVDFQSIDTQNPTSFGTSNAYPRENSFTITSPQWVTRTLLAVNSYNSWPANRAVLIFDDNASGSPSGSPVDGRFIPNQSLSVYNGTSPIGTWILTMSDSSAQDGVILHGFDVQLEQLPVCGDGVLDDWEICPQDSPEDPDQSQMRGPWWTGSYCGNGSIDLLTETMTMMVNEDFESLGNGTALSYVEHDAIWWYKIIYQNTGPWRWRYGTMAIQKNSWSWAITLDSITPGSYALNEFIIEKDLHDLLDKEKITLSYYYFKHGEVTQAQDTIQVRWSNTDTWLTVYYWSWVGGAVSNLNVSDVLYANDQTPSSTFQVKIAQYDNNSAISSTQTRWITIDDIVIKVGVLSWPSLDEQCDDGNMSNGDGCSHSCQIEPERVCTGSPSSCSMIPPSSGLVLHLDGSKLGSLFTDISGEGNNASNYNNVTTWSTNGDTVMCFNGSNQYLERATNLATSYPFTMSVWMKSNTISWLHGVMSFATISSSMTMYNIEYNGSTIIQRAQNTSARYTNSLTALTISDWYLVTAVYTSTTSRDIYINGVYESTSTTSATYDTSKRKRLNIGRLADSSPSNYFNGCVDDVRFYNSALTSGQVYQLYATTATLSTSLVASWSPLLTGTIWSPFDRITLTILGNMYTGTNNGDGTWSLTAWVISPSLSNGSYNITLNVINSYNKSVTYYSSFTVSLILTPAGTIYIGNPQLWLLTGVSMNTGSNIEYQFDYFSVADSKWINSGYYTTISLSSLNSSGWWVIPTTAIQRKAHPIAVLSGSANPRVTISTGIQSYIIANTVTTFIKRDTATNSSAKGQYGSKLSIKATIPAYQTPGAYSWTITYTLYEN